MNSKNTNSHLPLPPSEFDRTISLISHNIKVPLVSIQNIASFLLEYRDRMSEAKIQRKLNDIIDDAMFAYFEIERLAWIFQPENTLDNKESFSLRGAVLFVAKRIIRPLAKYYSHNFSINFETNYSSKNDMVHADKKNIQMVTWVCSKYLLSCADQSQDHRLQNFQLTLSATTNNLELSIKSFGECNKFENDKNSWFESFYEGKLDLRKAKEVMRTLGGDIIQTHHECEKGFRIVFLRK